MAQFITDQPHFTKHRLIRRGIDIGRNFVTSFALVTEPSKPKWPPVEDDCALYRDYSEESRVLVVSFSGLKQNPEAVPGFSLRRTFMGLPIKQLYLRDLDRAWFLRGLRGVTRDVDETVAFLRQEAAFVQARRVILTGYSLGGFAALLYGSLLGVDEVHAISPQTFLSFWRRLRARDNRWRRYVWPLHFGPTKLFHELRPWLSKVKGETKLHVHFASDSRLDTIHARYVTGLPGVIVHDHQKGGHRLVTALMESGQLRTIFERAIAGSG
jgi:hypothetical protein